MNFIPPPGKFLLLGPADINIIEHEREGILVMS